VEIGIVTQRIIKDDGQGRVNFEIAREALKRGHRVVMITTEVAPELDSYPSAEWVRVPVAGWPTALLREQIFAWRSTRWLRRHSHRLDVLQVNGFDTWTACDVNTAHFVHNAWLRSPARIVRLRRDPYGLYQYLYTLLNARWEKKAFGRAGVVVAVSGKIRDELEGIGVPDERIRVIPNGVDLREFCPGSADRAKLGLPQGVPLALFAGGIQTPRKNLDTVLRALVDVPELGLVVAGSGAQSPYLRMVDHLGLSDRVRFLGHRQDIPELLRAADLLVFPSRYEPLGLAVLEAMASGRPVVTAITAGAAELVDRKCGIVIDDPDDANALAAALKRLVRSPGDLETMGRAARAVAKRYSWELMVEHYMQLYEELADQKRLFRRDTPLYGT
jgi:glycosyltransferase involved in cell wall biosynthesis